MGCIVNESWIEDGDVIWKQLNTEKWRIDMTVA